MKGAGILAWLDRALGESPAHGKLHAASLSEAGELAGRLPYVHRTAKAKSPSPLQWLRIFEGGALPPGPTCTDWERAAGHSEAVYLFLGAGAYPHGQVALVFRSIPGPATFAPIDTGGLFAGKMVGGDGAQIDAVRGGRMFGELYADAGDLLPFAERWIAAHFGDPREYVERPMISEPDLPPLHGARSADGHRLAWTIEVQHHAEVLLPTHLAAVVCARRADARALPAAYRALARWDASRDLGEEGFFALISDTILSLVEAP